MILIKPFFVFVALILFYIPNLQFIGVALLFYIYHILIKNRNLHIQKMREVYKLKGIDFPIKNDYKKSFIFLYLYIFSLSILFYMTNTLTSELLALDINQIDQFQVETWESFILIASFLLMWFSYAFMINKIIKDQWVLQESEINNNIVKYRFIKLREGNLSMFLRILTFNLYEWFLIYILLRETTMHYIEDGTATGLYKKNLIKPKKEETDEIEKVKETNHFEELLKKIKDLDKEEKYSIIFYEVTNMEPKEAEEILDKLLKENYIDKEEYDKISSFL